MNKTILLIFVLISLAFVVNFASAKRVVRVTDNCKCDARAVVKCGFSKSDEAKKCRAVYSKKCNTRCNLINKCSNQIASECVSFKKGALEYKRCERATISKKCVSLLNKEELYNCKCKSFAKAVCGTCPSPAAVNCRDDAYENCKKQCGTKLPCKSKKRICITEKGCNCKAIAKSRCAVDEDRAGCYAKQYDACNKRCLASSRCYPVSCKNAGQKRCARAVAIVCDKFSADLNQYEQCVEKKTERCLSFERATCKKARRLFKYRSECDYAAKVTCEPLSAEKKCACVKEVREKCVKQKIQLRKKYIRHTATCRKRATLLCDAKEHCKDLRACYIEETKHCVRRHKRREHICPPECVEKVTDFCGSQEGECYKKNLEECTEQWLRRYCERNAFEVCDGDLECMKQEIAKCKHRVPKCWENRDLCNDHNKCTDDVCDPKVGCIHIAKTCNDNNLCTEDVCDPNEGCKNTEIKCDDGVACTKDYCNPVNGKCQFEKDHTRCTTSDKCTVGFCGDKGCEFKKDKTGKCKPREEICKDCVAKNKCQQVDCQIQDDLTPKCVVTELNCDDKKRCTEDYCDVATGKCVHNKISGEGCEPPLCEDILDCAAWSVKQKLSEQCFVAECNADLGVCAAKPVSNKDCVPVTECQEKCKPRDACEGPSTSCTRDKEGLVVCNRPDYPCDDHSECTKDACNLNTGVCSHVFVRNDKDCIEYCESDSFCIEWAIQSGLDEDCKTAVCDKQKKSCKVVPKLDTSRCGTSCKGCKKTKCDVSAKCVLDAQSKPACVRVQKKCDDENPCTVDTCDLETGKCVNTFVPSKVCKKCENAQDCEAWGKTLNLAPICKTAVCDAKTKRCVVSKLPGKCTTPVCVDCVAKNACEEAVCTFDSNGKPYCARSARTCDDNNDCTVDTCDLKTGKCIHEETKCKICNFDSQCKDWGVEKKLSETCQEAFCTRKGKCKARLSADQSKCPTKKQECVDCVSLNKCDSAKCVIESGIAKCVHSQTTCNDGDKCTTDYCDVTTGECVYKQIQSDECKICKADKDCADYAKQQKLSESCLESFCENNYCRERPTADQSKCLKIPLCYDCVATPCDETAQCKFDKDGKPVCERTKKVCNDNNKCTVDSCDLKTGDCVHTFFKTSQCEACETDVDCKEFAKIRNLDDNCETATCNPKGYCQISKNPDTSKCGNKCTTDKDCAAWAVDKKLADSCKEATCVANKCVARTMKDLSKCDKCRLECVAKNACETATCINSEAGYICDRTQKNCDDKQDCTADSCDVTSGKCVNKVIESEKCKICTVDKDCVAFAKVVKPNNCEEVFCDATLKLCSKRPIADKTCVPEEFCKLQCPVKDKCYDAKCHYDKNNKVVCDTPVLKNCDDKDDCTDDTCVPNRGCVHTTSNKCTKCLNVNDCTKYAISKELDAKCQEPFCNEKGNCDARPKADKKCVPSDICTKSCATPNKCQSFGCEYDVNGKVQCTYVIKTCDDAIECTKDYCDEKTGLCVHDRTKCGPPCQFTPNCVQWGAEQQLASKCQEAYCDQKIKACVAVKSSDATKCIDCAKVCVSKNKCETMKCAYDKNEKVICIPSPVPGCTPCKEEADCSGLKKTATQCEKVYCDAAQGKCIKESVKTPECTKVCPPTCQASSLCEVARIVQTETTCECKITPISCDDGKSCTEDSCDAKSGKCRNVFKTSDKCVKECTKDVECARFAIDNKLSDKCQVAYCDVKSGSCAVKDDDVTNCKKCQLECKPSNNCETAVCAWDGAKYTCARTTKTCDDGKSCTTDKCDAATGKCVYTYVCDTNICNTDLDCAAWGLANKLNSKCLIPVCNTKDATCKSVPDPKCKGICPTGLSSECPPTKFGSVCDKSTDTCKPNECYFDSDCLGKSTKDTWAYCKPLPYTGQKVCKEEPKCKANKDCDDKDPCTSDYCLAEYGFCHNIKKCDDKNECTIDIATPNKDNTCTCSHVPVSCTTDATLLAKSFVSLTADEKSKWLGKCDKNRGCISCVVNSQCDDHNGCSTDSCENQVCSNKYVTYNNGEFNPWCDPKLASQPIYFQSIPGLRDQLALAGYDINKLAN